MPFLLYARLRSLRSTVLIAWHHRRTVSLHISLPRLLFAPRARAYAVQTPGDWKALGAAFVAAGIALVRDPRLPHTINLPAINAARIGNGKTIVANAFERVFGYSLAVNPITYSGPMCAKSEANATHDGRAIAGPLRAQDVELNVSYQRLIDTRREVPGFGSVYEEYRTVLVGGQIAAVYRKRKREPFTASYVDFRLVDPEEAFSPMECAKLAELGRELGLGIGEFDVLRDSDDRPYVVDATNSASFEAVRRYAPRGDAASGARAVGNAIIMEFGAH